MASLTPGVLSKLLDNAGNRDFKVTGEHRSPLLQVIEIVPSLSGDYRDDPWKSKGFFLKVSDSLHSAYVSISDEDLDLIYSDKIQLGQFVYVSRLDSSGSGSRVPVIRGLKPVPNRRPCVGNPVDLVSSDALPIGQGQGFGFRKTRKSNNKSSQKDDKPKKSVSKLSVTTKLNRAGLLVNDNDRNMNTKVLETRRLSLDSARRVWDPRNASKIASGKVTTPPSTSKHISFPVVCEKKASSKNCSTIKHPILSISPQKNKDESLPKPTSRVTNKDIQSSSSGTTSNRHIKMPINLKTLSDYKIAWNALPSAVSGIGKQVFQNRNHSFLAATHALEEASATESVIRCMCMFAEISESSQKVSAGQLVEQILDLHQSLQQALVVVNSLLNKVHSEAKSSSHEIATSWVQAAIGTNLSNFKLLRMRETSETQNGERCHYVVIEYTSEELNSENCSDHQMKPSLRHHRNFLSDTSAKKLPSWSRCTLSATKEVSGKEEEWSRGRGLKEALSLAEKLLSVSRQWFLKYLEDLLNTEFELSIDEVSERSYLLRQLKRVNQWLGELVGSGMEVDEKIEDLRKKLYAFLLQHVDLAAVSSK